MLLIQKRSRYFGYSVDAKKVDLIKDAVNYFRHLVDVLDNVKITATFLT